MRSGREQTSWRAELSRSRPPAARPLIEAELRPLTGQHVAVALSGGIDSTSVALSLLELNCHLTAYSFCLYDRRSRDVKMAAENASTMGLRWRLVALPTDRDAILGDLRGIINRLDVDRKTTVETSWPFLHLMRAVQIEGLRHLVTGHCADGHFGSSRVGAMFHRAAEDLDRLRQRQFSDPDFCGVQTVRAIGRCHGVELVAPYRAQAVVDAYMGYSWEECNKPRPKEPVWRGYEQETRVLRLSRQPINLQLGDSGIAERLAEISVELGYRSPVSMYRAIRRGEL